MANRRENRFTDILKPGEVRRVPRRDRGSVQCLSGVLWITGMGSGDILLQPGECTDLGRLKKPCLSALGEEAVVYRGCCPRTVGRSVPGSSLSRTAVALAVG